MSIAITVLHCIPDAEAPGTQHVAVEINGVRCTLTGAPGDARGPEALAAWVRASYSDGDLAALAEARAAVQASTGPSRFFTVRECDLGGPLLPVAMRALLRRLNAVEAAANISPTTMNHLLEACRGESPAAVAAPATEPIEAPRGAVR